MLDDIIGIIFAVAVLALLAALGVMLWRGQHEPTMSLVKAEWECTAYESQMQLALYPQPDGRTIILPYNDQTCVKYERVKK